MCAVAGSLFTRCIRTNFIFGVHVLITKVVKVMPGHAPRCCHFHTKIGVTVISVTVLCLGFILSPSSALLSSFSVF